MSGVIQALQVGFDPGGRNQNFKKHFYKFGSRRCTHHSWDQLSFVRRADKYKENATIKVKYLQHCGWAMAFGLTNENQASTLNKGMEGVLLTKRKVRPGGSKN